MDAKSYAEASITILRILWDIANFNSSVVNPLWRKARVTALEALNNFEVSVSSPMVCSLCYSFTSSYLV